MPESGFGRVPGSGPEQAVRPLVGTAEQGGVIDPDVLWSCTTCGACVEQCPVDIEHVDHIVDMRRHQVMIESEFPSELGALFKNLENKGNPWGQNARNRLDWTKKLDFEVPVFDGELSPETEYLFWVGCAGAFDDGQQKTIQATAELLHRAGVGYVVLGPEESCTGDPARRSGNEFLFQMLAAQNVEVLNAVFEGREPGTRKIVTTCPHCLNTLGREYPQLDGHYEVVHHTQLLNKLVREGKLVPVAAPDAVGAGDLPRPVLPGPAQRGLRRAAGPGRRGRGDADRDAAARRPVDVLRRGRRADVDGGADRQAGERDPHRGGASRTLAGVGDGGTIAVGCPFCRTMLTDGITQAQGAGEGAGVQIQDVSQMLLAAVKRGDPATNGSGAPADRSRRPARPPEPPPLRRTTQPSGPRRSCRDGCAVGRSGCVVPVQQGRKPVIR